MAARTDQQMRSGSTPTVAGIAVHIAARVQAKADAVEICTDLGRFTAHGAVERPKSAR